MKTDRALFRGWLNAPGNTPTYFDDQVRNYLDDRFGIESNGRTTNTANLTLAHINLYLRGILAIKAKWDWLETQPPEKKQLWADYEATGKRDDALAVRDIYLNGLAMIRSDTSTGAYNPAPQFFARKVGPANNNRHDPNNVWPGSITRTEVEEWTREKVAPELGQSPREFNATWLPSGDWNNYIKQRAEEAGAQRQSDGSYRLPDGQDFRISLEEAEQFGYPIEEAQELIRSQEEQTIVAVDGAEPEKASTERLPRPEEVDRIVVNPSYQRVLANENALVDIFTHDLWAWRETKKPAVAGYVKKLIESGVQQGQANTNAPLSIPMLLRELPQRDMTTNSHRSDVLVRDKIIRECDTHEITEKITNNTTAFMSREGRSKIPLWQLVLLRHVEDRLSLTENRPTEAFIFGEPEKFTPDFGLEPTPHYANLQRSLEWLHGREAEIAVAGRNGAVLDDFRTQVPEAYIVFQQLELRYGSSAERVAKLKQDLQLPDPDAYYGGEYSTTRTATSHLTQRLIEKINQALTYNPQWSTEARNKGQQVYGLYQSLKIHYTAIAGNPALDKDANTVRRDLDSAAKQARAQGQKPEDNPRAAELTTELARLTEAIQRRDPNLNPYYQRAKETMRTWLRDRVKETLLNEREATKGLTEATAQSNQQLLQEARDILAGGSSRSGLHHGKRLSYDTAAALLWRQHLIVFKPALANQFPGYKADSAQLAGSGAAAPFDIATISRQLQTINQQAADHAQPQVIPDRLLQPASAASVRDRITAQFWEGIAQSIAHVDRRTYARILQQELKGDADLVEIVPLTQPDTGELTGEFQLNPNWAKLATPLALETNSSVLEEKLRSGIMAVQLALDDPGRRRQFNRYALVNNLTYQTTIDAQERIHFNTFSVRNPGPNAVTKVETFISDPASKTIQATLDIAANYFPNRPLAKPELVADTTAKTGPAFTR